MNYTDFANYSSYTVDKALAALDTLPIKYGPINNLYNALSKLKALRIRGVEVKKDGPDTVIDIRDI